MNKLLIILLNLGLLAFAVAQQSFQSDTIKTESGNIVLTFIGHGTLMFNVEGKIVHIDPVSRYADYSEMPKADLILITHHHGDHLDPEAVGHIRTEKTRIICSALCAEKLQDVTVMENGDSLEILGIAIDAVPAYNIKHLRDNGEPFHPKGVGNGYLLKYGGIKIYVAGDTENIPEMKNLSNIHIAFLPMNLPYTMTPEMVTDATEMFHPDILYPYHYGNTDVNELLKLMGDQKETEVRIRELR
ncbi:MAG: MBL fold metallo-hydrolase [Calditrichaeota bacterium]|nr:MBL fold metallo-hydrolase [Calditrichota bacterium]RQV93391.1 MAG: MBL fold metallo-hydrolase [bacterium]